ncbi:ABC transporter ATP-binding protein [Streptomyces sp. M19]
MARARRGADTAGTSGAPRSMTAAAVAGMPATPELLAKVAALPPATDTPDVDEGGPPGPRRRTGCASCCAASGGPRSRSAAGRPRRVRRAAAARPHPARHRPGRPAPALGAVWAASALALLVVIGQWAAQIGETWLTGKTGERVLYALRVKIFAQLQRLGLDYYERELTGRIMTRMTTDVDALTSFLQTGLVTAVVSVLTFLGILVALLVIDVELALVVFATLPILVVGTVFFRRHSVRAYELARERVSTVNADLQESVAGLRVVQAFRGSAPGASASPGAATATGRRGCADSG